MSDIKVGEYIRTKNGRIGKVLEVSYKKEHCRYDHDRYLVKWDYKTCYYIGNKTIENHSSYKTDIVEVRRLCKRRINNTNRI